MFNAPGSLAVIASPPQVGVAISVFRVEIATPGLNASLAMTNTPDTFPFRFPAA